MRKIIVSMEPIYLAVASCASILGLAFVPSISIFIKIPVVIIAISGLILLIAKIRLQSQDNSIICHSDDEIKEAMIGIIKSQGKICIMSRDLSWVDEDVESCIIAKRNSVLIFAENEVDSAKRLKEKGVNVLFYGCLGFEPKTRFTVIRYNRSDPQVAIANTQNSVRKKSAFSHIIYQTEKNGIRQDEWINSLCVDLIGLCEHACKKMEQKNDK